MGTGIFFPISALAFSLIIIILFYVKKPINSVETKLYKYLIISNLFGLVIEILCTYAAYINLTKPFLSNLILKTYLVYNIFWVLVLTIYVLYISFNEIFSKNLSRIKVIVTTLFVMASISIYALRCDLIIENDFAVRYTTGPSVKFTYILSAIFMGIMLFSIIKNYRNLTNKYIPIYIFLMAIFVGIIIQSNNPGLLIMTYVETITVTIMYFTIENPDIKVLNELYRNRELMEQNYDDKYNFLFELTQMARMPLTNIMQICREMKETDDPRRVIAGSELINDLVRQLDFSINDIMNVSTLDAQKLKFVDSRYDLTKLCSDLEFRCRKDNVNNIEFKCDYPEDNIMLYGDCMKLKQILYSLITTALRKTQNGYVEFNVNKLEKYDVCRLVFSINDSGQGMSLEKVNEILGATGELNQQEIENVEKNEMNIKLCQKVIKLMNGNLLIKSNLGKGTEIKLTIDQRVYHDSNDDILSMYENIINSYRKVLVVSQNKKLINKLKNKLSVDSMSCSVLLNGNDAIDKIKAGKKYDYILISDEMKEISGLMTLKEMQKIKKFDVPCIVMLDSSKENIKDAFIEDGFSDYLLINDFDNEIDRIVKKY